MKRYAQILSAALCLGFVALCLPGCAGKQNAASPAQTPVTLPGEPADTPAAAPVQQEAALTENARAAYKAALTDLLNSHALPDGTDLGHDEFGDPAGNRFAVCDVDRDGRRELILVYTTTAMAGQTAGVYDYDEAARQLRSELTEYPLLTFYDNGVIKALWSHNQGLGGDFWPYSFYRYDADKDVYTLTGMADAWEKALSPTDFQGNPYPEDLDTGKTGYVYYLIDGPEYREVPPVDASAYESWADGYLSGAAELAVAFWALTEENIEGALGE